MTLLLQIRSTLNFYMVRCFCIIISHRFCSILFYSKVTTITFNYFYLLLLPILPFFSLSLTLSLLTPFKENYTMPVLFVLLFCTLSNHNNYLALSFRIHGMVDCALLVVCQHFRFYFFVFHLWP